MRARMIEVAVCVWNITGEIGESNNDAQFSLLKDQRSKSRR